MLVLGDFHPLADPALLALSQYAAAGSLPPEQAVALRLLAGKLATHPTDFTLTVGGKSLSGSNVIALPATAPPAPLRNTNAFPLYLWVATPRHAKGLHQSR